MLGAPIVFDLLCQVLDKLLLSHHCLSLLLEALTYILIAFQMEINVLLGLCYLFYLLLNHLKCLQLIVGLRVLELLSHQVLYLFLDLQLLKKLVVPLLKLLLALL